tara:strand:- start:2 stop:259 length:258 start_codon:yes stop_codon:yes gene_type:complete
MTVMNYTLHEAVFDYFFSPMRTVYLVSNSQLEEIKPNQREEELESIKDSLKRLGKNYQSQVKVLDEGKQERQEEFKALTPAKREK